MRVFMLGWEYPPYISGGLGTACYGLTEAMSHLGVEIVFALPRSVGNYAKTFVKIVSGHTGSSHNENRAPLSFRSLKACALGAYTRPFSRSYMEPVSVGGVPQNLALRNSKDDKNAVDHYGGDLLTEVLRYAGSALKLSLSENFDIVHAHDWMTFPAGEAVSVETGKPLIVHIHSTEFDRSGEHVHQAVYDIERRGLHRAEQVIAVSQRTRAILIERYGVPDWKIHVVYNGVIRNGRVYIDRIEAGKRSNDRVVLFLGRITMQKGPEYFLQAAKAVLDYREDVVFVMAGNGDQLNRCIELAAELGIGDRVLFTGFLQGSDVRRIYEMADLYVMPSVSEPFGIAPLEAIDHHVPVLISNQSGVSEVLSHVLKVDFWDTREMANKILAVLTHTPLHTTLRQHGVQELARLDWLQAAQNCLRVYQQLQGVVRQ